MKINKAQGQALVHIRMYPPLPAFPHGQLYVALSRSSSLDKVPVPIIEAGRQRIESEKIHKLNTVYREAL